MASATLIAAAEKALRIVTTSFEDEIGSLLDAALLDMGVAGVTVPTEIDALVQQAAITYVKMNFGIGQDYEMTYKQIAEAEGCTQERVRQIIVSALKKMKN